MKEQAKSSARGLIGRDPAESEFLGNTSLNSGCVAVVDSQPPSTEIRLPKDRKPNRMPLPAVTHTDICLGQYDKGALAAGEAFTLTHINSFSFFHVQRQRLQSLRPSRPTRVKCGQRVHQVKHRIGWFFIASSLKTSTSCAAVWCRASLGIAVQQL